MKRREERTTEEMESSKNFDIPPVLKPDVERRLLRVFALLRQHDRKTKLAKKTAELSTVKDLSKRVAAAVPVAKSVEERDLLGQELFGNQRADSTSVASAEAHAAVDSSVDKTRETVVSILENEIEELQRTINFKDFDTSGSISGADLNSSFRALNRPTPKAEVQWMIWEADDDLDGSIDWDEFRGAYARCVVDKQGMEPSQLFHFIHFLLSDPDGGGSVSVADVRAELQRIRGTDHLVNKIKKALGATTDQQEQQRHPLEHYLDAVLTQLPTSVASGNHFPPKQ